MGKIKDKALSQTNPRKKPANAPVADSAETLAKLTYALKSYTAERRQDGWWMCKTPFTAAGEKPNEAALRRQFNAIKPIEFPWILDLPKSVPQQAIKNVGRAYQRFFQKKSKFPRFKKRGVHDSARLDNGPGTFQCEGSRIQLPKIGWVRMHETLRFDGKPLSATLSREADRWFIAINVSRTRAGQVGHFAQRLNLRKYVFEQIPRFLIQPGNGVEGGVRIKVSHGEQSFLLFPI